MKPFVGNKIYSVFFLFVLISLVAITTLSLSNIRDSRGRATILNSTETESGILSGNAHLVNDALASNGQYVEFSNAPIVTSKPSTKPVNTIRPSNTSVPPLPTNAPNNSLPQVPNISFQPSAPYYGTFYYMWYQNPNTDSSWSYWTDNGSNPPNSWFSHYLPDPKPGVFDPATELYSTNNYSNFRWQVSKMAEARQEVAIASWWGPGTKEDTAFNSIINSFMGKSDNPYPNLRWAVYYEDEGFADPSIDTIAADLNYLKSKYATSPYMLKINGKPVIFVYAGANDVPGTMVDRWYRANTQVGNSFYTVLKVFPGYASVASQPDSWHQYAPAKRTDDASPHSYMVSPGFWLDNGSGERLSRDHVSFELGVKSMVAANAKWKLVETWNEWGEGTSVEPGVHVQLNPSTGKNEIKPNGYPFGNLYIDILSRNLPPLEVSNANSTNTPHLTSPPINSTGDPVIIAASDVICDSPDSCHGTVLSASQVAINHKPSAVLVVGDLCHTPSSNCFSKYYDTSWGRLKSISYPVPGNHEYLDKGAPDYFNYWGSKAGDSSKGYYSFNIGAWHIIALNSQCGEVGGCNTGSPQYQWLQQDLTNNTAKCTLAYYHIPTFSSGGRANPNMKQIFSLLYDKGAEIVLSGHDHIYERFSPQNGSGQADSARGVRQFIVGTAGANHTSLASTQPNSEVRNDQTFGALKLTLHSDSYDAEFVPSTESSFTDKITNVSCH